MYVVIYDGGKRFDCFQRPNFIAFYRRQLTSFTPWPDIVYFPLIEGYQVPDEL
jgi:hypothetical protein